MAKLDYDKAKPAILAYYPEDMHPDEVDYIEDELAKKVPYQLARIDINYHADGGIIIRPQYNTINRVRRITGYLSALPKFNDAKRAEERDRVSHFGGDSD